MTLADHLTGNEYVFLQFVFAPCVPLVSQANVKHKLKAFALLVLGSLRVLKETVRKHGRSYQDGTQADIRLSRSWVGPLGLLKSGSA